MCMHMHRYMCVYIYFVHHETNTFEDSGSVHKKSMYSLCCEGTKFLFANAVFLSYLICKWNSY